MKYLEQITILYNELKLSFQESKQDDTVTILCALPLLALITACIRLRIDLIKFDIVKYDYAMDFGVYKAV